MAQIDRIDHLAMIVDHFVVVLESLTDSKNSAAHNSDTANSRENRRRRIFDVQFCMLDPLTEAHFIIPFFESL
jgi:hypothetical protein